MPLVLLMTVPVLVGPVKRLLHRTSHLRDRFLPSTVTAAVKHGRTHNIISAQTVRNSLAERGIRARRPYHGPILTQRLETSVGHWTLELGKKSMEYGNVH